MKHPVRTLVACVLALFCAWPGFATERFHRVGPGESASSIAKRYYGDYGLAELLIEYNGGGDSTVIRIGQELRIPVCPEHDVRSGDTWSVLTDRFVGRGEVWPAVATLNGLLPDKPLSIGTRIVFPVVIRHALRRGETLAVLADRYYGDPKRANVLQQFNAIVDPRRLSVGESIDIPLIAFRADGPAAPPEKVAKTKTPEPPKGQPFDEPLDEAALALDRGEFEQAREQIESLLDRVQAEGTKAAKARLWEMAAVVHIAFDDYDRACVAYRQLAALPATPDLDPDRISPKIRNTHESCNR